MIRPSNFILKLSIQQLKVLSNSKPWIGNFWDSPPNSDLKDVKREISRQLREKQTHCAYCGLELGGTSRGQIEHIAPKGGGRYPEFTFSLWNLVMACDHCNGFSKKGNINTISSLNDRYKKCSFLLVHPYFDNPDNHYEWIDEVVISVKSNSVKGAFSIEKFKLDSPKMTELRAKKKMSDLIIARFPLTSKDEELISRVRNYVNP